MQPNLLRKHPPDKAGAIADRADPPEVATFRALAESRRRSDRSRIHPLQAELRPAPGSGAFDTALWALGEGFWPVALRRPGEAIRDEAGERVAIGKEPRRNAWGAVRPSRDSLRSDFGGESEGGGVGLRLGPSGGWSDIEGDGPEWEEQFTTLCGGESLETLGYDSRRGGHNMVLPPPPELAMIPSGFKVGWCPEYSDLEIRLNGKDSQSQSVIPPTTTDDFARTWRGPWRIAPLPDYAVAELTKIWEEDQRRKRAANQAGSRSKTKRSREGEGAVSTIDQWNQEQGRDGILALLESHGWRLVKTGADGVLYVRHPNATGPWSGSIGWCGDRLYIWSNNTPFPVGKAYDAFDVLRTLEHGDDFRGALTALRDRGYGRNGRAHSGSNGHPAAEPEPAGGGGDGGDHEGGEKPRPAPEPIPEILVTTKEHEVIGKAVSALRAEPELYQRGNVLVTIMRDSIKGKGFRRPPNTPRIGAIPGPRLREMVTRHATLIKARKARSGEWEYVPTHPPDFLVPAILARGEWEDIRHVEGIVEAPTIRPDGSILDRPGWDEATGLLYEPNGTFGSIPADPTRDDAMNAAARLLHLVADFPFVDDENRAAWLAALLTSMARYAIDGPTPLFLFDANSPGTGKSLLCHLIALVCRGRMMACADYPENEEEMAKTLLAIALAGDPFVLFDNVSTGFSIGGKSLDRALTAPTVKGRILGRSEMSAELPWNSVVFVSGNNLGIKGDALRRVAPSRLETQEEQPEERTDYEIKDIVRHVREHRGEFVADALTILRAHAIAGRPDPGLTPIGTYEDWCRVIRNAVHWSTGHDPAGPRKRARADDQETQANEALVGGWSLLCREAPEGLTAKEALDRINAGGPSHEDLRCLLSEWSRDGGLPSARVMGNRLGKIRGRMTAKGALDFTVYLGNRRWFVKPPKPPHSGGSSGSGDSVPGLRAENCNDNCNTRIPPYGANGSHQRHQSHQGAYAASDPDDFNPGPAF